MRKFIIIVVASLVPVGMWTAGCRQNNKQAAFPKTSEMKALAKNTEKKNSNLPPEIPPAPIDRDILNLPENATLARVQALDDRTNVLAKSSPDAGLFTLPEEKYRIAQAEPVHESVPGSLTSGQEKRGFWSKSTPARGRTGAKTHDDVSAMAPAASDAHYFDDLSGGGTLQFIPAPSEAEAAPEPLKHRKLLPPEDVPGIFLGDDQPLSSRHRGRASAPNRETAGLAGSDALGASPFLSGAQANPRRSAQRKKALTSPGELSARDFGARDTASRTRAPRKTAARKMLDRDRAAVREIYRHEPETFADGYSLASAPASPVRASRDLPSGASVVSDVSAGAPSGAGPLRLDLSGLMGAKSSPVSEAPLAGAGPAAARTLAGVSALDTPMYNAPLPAGPLLFPEPGLPEVAVSPVSLAGSAAFGGAPHPVADSLSDNASASAAGAGVGLAGPAPLPMDEGLAKSLASAETRPASRPASADLKQALAPLPDLSSPAAVRQRREALQSPPIMTAKRPDAALAAGTAASAGTAQPSGALPVSEKKPAAAKAADIVKSPEPEAEKQLAMQKIPDAAPVSNPVKPAGKAGNSAAPPLSMPAPVLSPLPTPELAAAKAALMEPLLDSPAKPAPLSNREFFKTDFWENKTASSPSLQPSEAKLPEVSLADLQMPEMKMPDLPLPDAKKPAVKMPEAVPPAKEMPEPRAPESKAPVTPPTPLEIPLTPRAPDWVDLPPVAANDKVVGEKTVEVSKAEVKAEVKTEVKAEVKNETPVTTDEAAPQRVTLKPVRAKREMNQIDAETEVPPLRF